MSHRKWSRIKEGTKKFIIIKFDDLLLILAI